MKTMIENDCSWKHDWPATRQHFTDWWAGTGLLVAQMWPPYADTPLQPGWEIEPVPGCESPQWRLENSHWRAREQFDHMSRMRFPGDTLPCSSTDFGPGNLAIYLGSRPEHNGHSVWFHPAFEEVAEPEGLPPLRFDPAGGWWKITEEMLTTYHRIAEGKVLTPMPDLGSGLDVLASLRGTQTLLLDIHDRPDWVAAKLAEISEAYLEAWEREYQMTKQPDGSSCCCAYRVWGPGRVMMQYCDFSSMISADVFRRFMVPIIEGENALADHAYFHLDGHECLRHLDALLGIEKLGAIEWTPSPNQPHGASPCYFEMYEQIRAAGKSILLIEIPPETVIPLLDAIGPHGLYIHTDLSEPGRAEELLAKVDSYRK